MSEITLQVSGMTCAGCGKSVNRAVGEMVGVSYVSADWEKGQVMVAFDETQTSLSDIKEAIEDAGFDVL